LQTRTSFLTQTYKNMLSGYGAIVLGVIVNIFLLPVVLNNVGKELYGLWFLIFNITSYFYLADFGITNAITRLFAKYKVLGQDKVKNLLSTAYIIIFVLDLFILLLILLFKQNIIQYLGIDNRNLEIFSLLFIIAVIELLSQFILRVNFGIIKGKHHYNIAYNLEALTSILRLLSIFILTITDNFTIVNFALLYSLSKILSDSISFYFLKSEFKSLKFKTDFTILKDLINNASSTLLTSIASTAYNSLPLLLFGKVFGLEKVFLYSIPFAIMIVMSRLINVVYAGFTPRASELKALNDDEEIYKISNYGIKISLILGITSLSFFIIFGFDIFVLWLGDKVLTIADFNMIYNIFILLLTYLTIANFQKVNIVIYQAAGLHWYVTFETITSAILLLLLSYLLFDIFGMYVFAVSMICVSLYKYIYYQFRGRKKIKTYSLSLPILMLSSVFIGIIFIINLLFLKAISFKFLFFLLMISIFILFVYLRLFDKEEQNQIKRQLFIKVKKINYI
jgi:O-antigen/teichoic acid export membrane protein